VSLESNVNRWRGLVSASYIYVHTLKLPVAITSPSAGVCARRPANIRFGSGVQPGFPCAGALLSPVLKSTSLQDRPIFVPRLALYQGGILRSKKRLSHHFTFMEITLQQSHRTRRPISNSDYGRMTRRSWPQNVVSLALTAAQGGGRGRDQILGKVVSFRLRNWPIFSLQRSHPFNLLAGTNVNNGRHSTRTVPRELDLHRRWPELRQF